MKSTGEGPTLWITVCLQNSTGTMYRLPFERDWEGSVKEQIFTCMSLKETVEWCEAFSGSAGQAASCLLSQHPETEMESTTSLRQARASESETLSQTIKRQTLRSHLSEVPKAKPGSWGQKMEWWHAKGLERGGWIFVLMKTDFDLEGNEGLQQWFPSFLRLSPFKTVPRIMVTPSHKIIFVAIQN